MGCAPRHIRVRAFPALLLPLVAITVSPVLYSLALFQKCQRCSDFCSCCARLLQLLLATGRLVHGERLHDHGPSRGLHYQPPACSHQNGGVRPSAGKCYRFSDAAAQSEGAAMAKHGWMAQPQNGVADTAVGIMPSTL